MGVTTAAPRAARRLAPLLALLPLAGCGTLRLYDGPALPRDQVAQVREFSDPLPFLSGGRAVAVGFDGQPLEDHAEKILEMLPGPHALDVEGEAVGQPVRGTLRFTAEAGGDYELWLSTGAHSRGAILLRDAQRGGTLADTEPAPEQARSAGLTFDPGWHVVQWHLDPANAGQVWVPAGESEKAWTQSVSTGARRVQGGDAATLLDAQAQLLCDLAARRTPPMACTRLDSGPAHRVVGFQGLETPAGPESWSLTCIRVHDGALHMLSYSSRSHADYLAHEARWRAAFLDAQLAFPAP